MKPFPSPEERSVASALLLLSATSAAPPPFPSPPPAARRAKQLSLSFSLMRSGKTGSKSCASSLTSDGSSSKAPIRSLNQLKTVGVAARSCNGMNLKVARKKRTQVVRWTNSDRSSFPKKTDSFSGSVSTEHDSCLSSASFASSAAARGICFMKTARANQTTALINTRKKAQSVVHSARLRHQAEAIMKLLSGGRFSEVRIRQVFGDSPDTSKALRMLLRREDIKRSGTGGRCDPYIYTVA